MSTTNYHDAAENVEKTLFSGDKDTKNSNIPQDDPIAESNEHTNENSTNERPTFNRTYDKNASDETEIDSDSAGKFDGEIGI